MKGKKPKGKQCRYRIKTKTKDRHGLIRREKGKYQPICIICIAST